MDNVTVLITGAGAPGIRGTLYSLKANFDGREIRTIGTDIRESVVGRYLCDGFHQVPKPSDEVSFVSTFMEICEREGVDVILPQVTAELEVLASYAPNFNEKGTTVAISRTDSIRSSNNKYELLKTSEAIGVPTPRFHLVNSWDGLEGALEALGYPEKRAVIKPPVSHGMVGFRIIDDEYDKKRAFLNEKPDGTVLSKGELDFLGDEFPDLMVMEYLPGVEYTVDVLAGGEKKSTVVPRRRDSIRTGITFRGTVEKDEDIIEYSERLMGEIGLDYAFGFQFKRDGEGVAKIIECNPRIQGTMALSTLAGANVVYGAVKKALGEDVPEFEIRWGTELLRFWGGIGALDGKRVAEI